MYIIIIIIIITMKYLKKLTIELNTVKSQIQEPALFVHCRLFIFPLNWKVTIFGGKKQQPEKMTSLQ